MSNKRSFEEYDQAPFNAKRVKLTYEDIKVVELYPRPPLLILLN
jgi:hypothetical protein